MIIFASTLARELDELSRGWSQSEAAAGLVCGGLVRNSIVAVLSQKRQVQPPSRTLTFTFTVRRPQNFTTSLLPLPHPVPFAPLPLPLSHFYLPSTHHPSSPPSSSSPASRNLTAFASAHLTAACIAGVLHLSCHVTFVLSRRDLTSRNLSTTRNLRHLTNSS